MLNSVRSKFANLWEESQCMGVRALGYRVQSEVSKRLGLDVKRHPVKQLSSEQRLAGCPPDVVADPDRFHDWWLKQSTPFFIQGADGLSSFYKLNLSADHRRRLIDLGYKAAKGNILAFRSWEADFGCPPDWSLNPVTGAHWPLNQHSKRVLDKQTKRACGDVKYTWELGRFLHVADVVRAYAMSGDATLIDRLFEQIESFDARNPIHQGPHWISEQEVGIRACMFAFVLYALKDSDCLNGKRVMTILRQLAASAEYCMEEIEFARRCVANNHVIGGALGMFVPACLMPWHKQAGAWLNRSRSLILESLESQWWPDGGYIQPSHNYHRLALSYLLWILRLAEIHDDAELVSEIKERFARAFSLLNSMIDETSGMLPNWGPNDGALFPPWTSCDYADFRPLLNAMGFALREAKQYQDGPWDEPLFWLWGPRGLSAPVDHRPPREGSFSQAGLHCIRQTESTAVLRCGPILSRYGQQADQLHLDLCWHGKNMLRDAGSYSYADSHYHEWFRSTDAHNTIVVDNQSQMVPRRQFLFLNWPRVETFNLHTALPQVRKWHGGWHTGYLRLPQRVIHGRLLLDVADDCWLVLDLLVAGDPNPPATIDVRWHLPVQPHQIDGGSLQLDVDDHAFTMLWRGLPAQDVQLETASDEKPDGWHSRCYGKKEPALSLRLTSELNRTMLLATWLGPDEKRPSLVSDADREQVEIDALRLSLTPFFNELRGQVG